MYQITSTADFETLFKIPFEPQKILYSLNSDFFRISNDLRKVGSQQLAVDLDDEDNFYRPLPEFPCGETGCRASFTTVHDYEVHCRSVHSLVCSQCKKNFPTYNMLDIHIQEKHDSYHEAAKARNLAKFECFVEGCDLTYSSGEDRDAHVIKDHNYPSNFKFQRLKSTVDKCEDMEITQEHELPKASVSYQHVKQKPQVPRTITFGRGASRTFQKVPKGKSNRDISMKELADAL